MAWYELSRPPFPKFGRIGRIRTNEWNFAVSFHRDTFQLDSAETWTTGAESRFMCARLRPISNEELEKARRSSDAPFPGVDIRKE